MHDKLVKCKNMNQDTSVIRTWIKKCMENMNQDTSVIRTWIKKFMENIY